VTVSNKFQAKIAKASRLHLEKLFRDKFLGGIDPSGDINLDLLKGIENLACDLVE